MNLHSAPVLSELDALEASFMNVSPSALLDCGHAEVRDSLPARTLPGAQEKDALRTCVFREQQVHDKNRSFVLLSLVFFAILVHSFSLMAGMFSLQVPALIPCHNQAQDN